MSGVASNVGGAGWKNKHWAGIPDYLRVILDDLSNFLSHPVFPNGIVVGNGQLPTRDPVTGIWTIPGKVAVDKDGIHPTRPGDTLSWSLNVNLQSDHYSDSGHPWPGWKLWHSTDGPGADGHDLVEVDYLLANVINARGTTLRFQFVGSDVDDHSGDFGSISMSQSGSLSAVSVVTPTITNNVDGGPTLAVTLNGGAVFGSSGGLDNSDYLRVDGVDVSLNGHSHDHGTLSGLSDDDHPQYHNDSRAYTKTLADARYAPIAYTDHGALGGLGDDDHTQYLNTTRGDARYSLLGHTHSGSIDHGSLSGLGDDDHTQYHNNSRGDARYSALGHTHGGISAAYGGRFQGNTDGSGDVVITHGLGFTPISVTMVHTTIGGPTLGGAGLNPVVHAVDSSTFTVRIHQSDNFAAVTSTNISLFWIAVG